LKYGVNGLKREKGFQEGLYAFVLSLSTENSQEKNRGIPQKVKISINNSLGYVLTARLEDPSSE